MRVGNVFLVSVCQFRFDFETVDTETSFFV